MSYRPIFTAGSKHLFISKADIIDCWVMSNQLSLHALSFNVPNCACSINRASSYHRGHSWVPVKRSYRCSVVRIYLNKLSKWIKSLTFLRILCSLKVFVSSYTSHTLKYSAVVASMSFLCPSVSGIHIILVGGNSCLNSFIFLKPSLGLSNLRSIMST